MAKDDFYASALGAVYSAYMEHPRVGLKIGKAAWGGDFRHYYEAMSAIGEVAPGSTVVDCPCGAGPAFRALRPHADVRYVAADLSPSMLVRARKRAAARGLDAIEFLEADATELPLADSSADLFLSNWGLHCFADPAAALAETARVLRPGGRLVGASFVRGRDTLRQRFFIRPGVGGFGAIGTQAEIESWLAAAGFSAPQTSRSGPMLFVDARLQGR